MATALLTLTSTALLTLCKSTLWLRAGPAGLWGHPTTLGALLADLQPEGTSQQCHPLAGFSTPIQPGSHCPGSLNTTKPSSLLSSPPSVVFSSAPCFLIWPLSLHGLASDHALTHSMHLNRLGTVLGLTGHDPLTTR